MLPESDLHLKDFRNDLMDSFNNQLRNSWHNLTAPSPCDFIPQNMCISDLRAPAQRCLPDHSVESYFSHCYPHHTKIFIQLCLHNTYHFLKYITLYLFTPCLSPSVSHEVYQVQNFVCLVLCCISTFPAHQPSFGRPP